ncbi:M48 family metalloprotease [Antarctobacter sp.]|uniref:M48 family metalloprotease n=1 Tax=Antarctobacter sp. TaxID=1872577 RepID=UPI003A91BB0B
MPKRFIRRFLLPFTLLFLTACGTNYTLPDVSATSDATAKRLFAEERQRPVATVKMSPDKALRQFVRVAKRIEPVAERFCRQETAEKKGFDCDVQILIDEGTAERNAYQSYAKDGTPIITFTPLMILDARNEDEIAFILGHEFGHHIGQHIKKGQQQAAVGGLILGGLMAAAQAQSAGTPYYDANAAQQGIEDAVGLGYALGNRAFSQQYELESDVIGTIIARSAGFDPVKGARYFARPEPVRRADGKLSFWGTHPPDEKRLAVVIEAAAALERGEGIRRKK